MNQRYCQIRVTLCGFADCRARQSKWTKRSNEMALTTWAEDEISGRTRIAWISWNLATIMVLMCQP